MTPTHVDARKVLLNILAALSVTVFFVLFLAKTASAADFFASISHVDATLLALAFGIYILAFLLRSWRFFALGILDSVQQTLLIVPIYYFINSVLPGNLGDFSFPVILKKMYGTSYAESFSGIIVARVFDLAHLLMFFLTIITLHAYGLSLFLFIPLILIEEIAFVSLFVVLSRKAAHASQHFFGHSNNRFAEFMHRIIVFQNTHSVRQIIKIAILSLSITFLLFLNGWVLMSALGIRLSLVTAVLGNGLSMIGSVIPIGGFFSLGTTEAGWVFALVRSGISLSVSLLASVNFHFVNFLFGAVLFVGSIVGDLGLQWRNK